jgi:hypothetical protein
MQRKPGRIRPDDGDAAVPADEGSDRGAETDVEHAGGLARARASSGKAKGASTSAAISQRQKLSATGSNASRSARPMTQFPAQRRFASASSEKANARLFMSTPPV